MGWGKLFFFLIYDRENDERAREILQNLEGGEFDAQGRPRLAGHAGDAPASTGDPGDQLGLFAGAGAPSPEEARVLDAVRSADPDATTPLEALALLARLKEMLGEPR